MWAIPNHGDGWVTAYRSQYAAEAGSGVGRRPAKVTVAVDPDGDMLGVVYPPDSTIRDDGYPAMIRREHIFESQFTYGSADVEKRHGARVVRLSIEAAP